MSGVNYYPIFSGGQNINVGNAAWATHESANFKDENTGATIDTGKRFQCITLKNIGSLGLVITFGNSSSIVSSTAASEGYVVAAGETRRVEVFSLGGSIGVKAVGVRVDPALLNVNVGPVTFGSGFLYAEFGNQ